MANILLVEDDASLRSAIVRMLREAGLQVHPARDYFEVAQLLDEPNRVDLGILDIGLPIGTPHGFAVARMARMRQPGMKIIFITGGEVPDIELIEPLGPILRKPFDMDDLLVMVMTSLEQSQALRSA